MAQKKWYVVWKGIEPGIYYTWLDCKRQIDGFENALYKSFESSEEAKEAFHTGPWQYIGKRREKLSSVSSGEIIRQSLSVDAACSGNPGRMEYRGVHTATGEEIFHIGPLEQGTNNVGEFLAIVHALALLKKGGSDLPVYSDSANAITWIKKKKCNTKLASSDANKIIFDLIERAENWLKNNTYTTTILKWETGEWGEIPADFGRK
ncbi:MAG: ribonuclease H family protein [Candidatus Symbiothrix sp.]|jgi:ribonuclease HI|nr:ribonuclease H family protein [Candidatus Symbiothrix sp.]